MDNHYDLRDIPDIIRCKVFIFQHPLSNTLQTGETLFVGLHLVLKYLVLLQLSCQGGVGESQAVIGNYCF